MIGASTDKGAEKACNTALKRLTKHLVEDNSIRVLDFARVKPEPGERKKPTQPTGIRQTATVSGARFILI